MAPLPLEHNASAVALVTFVRAFAQAWGVAVSGTILQNALLARLPAPVLALFPPNEHAELAYAVIPKIPQFEAGVREETQDAFAQSLREVWVVMCVLCGVGMGSVLVIREYTLRKTTDRRWGLKERPGEGRDEERSAGADEKTADGDEKDEEAEEKAEDREEKLEGAAQSVVALARSCGGETEAESDATVLGP